MTSEAVAAVTWMVERTVTQHILHPRESSDDRLVAALSRTIWLTITAGAE